MGRRKAPQAVASSRSVRLPELTSDRMRLLGPLVTPHALELARQRLVNHRYRITEANADDTTKRIALILLLEMNPAAILTNEEEGLRRGVHHETIGKLKASREL